LQNKKGWTINQIVQPFFIYINAALLTSCVMDFPFWKADFYFWKMDFPFW